MRFILGTSFDENKAKSLEALGPDNGGTVSVGDIHFHMLFLHGAHVERPDGSVRFHSVKAPLITELPQLAGTIARHRVGRLLERYGLLEGDAESSDPVGEARDAGALDHLLGHSITYRIAVGPPAGRKVFTL